MADRIVGAMVERFRQPLDDKVVPTRVKKELCKRLLIRDFEGTRLSALLSDRYLAGVTMKLRDWEKAAADLSGLTNNPRKRIKLSASQDLTRKGIFQRIELLLQKHRENKNDHDLLTLVERDSTFESLCTELCLSLEWTYSLHRVGMLTREGTRAWNVLRPSELPLNFSFGQKLAWFSPNDERLTHADKGTNRGSPYVFTLVSENGMKRLVRQAFELNLPIKEAIHSSSDFYSQIEELELRNETGIQQSSVSLNLFPFQ